jgi:hypothetical protein
MALSARRSEKRIDDRDCYLVRPVPLTILMLGSGRVGSAMAAPSRRRSRVSGVEPYGSASTLPSLSVPNSAETWPSFVPTVQPAIACGQHECPGKSRFVSSAPGRIRTYDTRFRKPMLYPLSYGSEAA